MNPCKKCESKLLPIVRWHGYDQPGRTASCPIEEHLHYTCPACRYQWTGPTCDHDQKDRIDQTVKKAMEETCKSAIRSIKASADLNEGELGTASCGTCKYIFCPVFPSHCTHPSLEKKNIMRLIYPEMVGTCEDYEFTARPVKNCEPTKEQYCQDEPPKYPGIMYDKGNENLPEGYRQVTSWFGGCSVDDGVRLSRISVEKEFDIHSYSAFDDRVIFTVRNKEK